jgi:6,7-dimethyl-8-ribityllumazine synthase
MSLRIHPDVANEAYTAAHAIAGFQLADIAFGVLVNNGILPKSDAERLLKQAIAGNKTGNRAHQAAAELLAIVLQTVFEFQPPTRQ